MVRLDYAVSSIGSSVFRVEGYRLVVEGKSLDKAALPPLQSRIYSHGPYIKAVPTTADKTHMGLMGLWRLNSRHALATSALQQLKSKASTPNPRREVPEDLEGCSGDSTIRRGMWGTVSIRGSTIRGCYVQY